jgi:hypothetical protein
MVPTLFFYQLGLVALVWFFLMLYWLWPNDAAARRQPIVPTTPSRRKHSKEPQPLVVYLSPADKYHRLTRRLSKEQKVL